MGSLDAHWADPQLHLQRPRERWLSRGSGEGGCHPHGCSAKGEDFSPQTQAVLALNLDSRRFFSCRVLDRLLKHLTLSFLTYKTGGEHSNELLGYVMLRGFGEVKP